MPRPLPRSRCRQTGGTPNGSPEHAIGGRSESLARVAIGFLLIGLGMGYACSVLQARAPGKESEGRPEDYPAKPDQARQRGVKDRKMSSAERRVLAARFRLRKEVDKRFRRQPRADNRFARKSLDDYFVVVRFEVPLAAREAEVRFEVSGGVEPSVDKIADYLLQRPPRSVRDYTIVARYGSLPDAEDAIRAARKRYDDTKAYQAQLLAYLVKQQRVKAASMRRC